VERRVSGVRRLGKSEGKASKVRPKKGFGRWRDSRAYRGVVPKT